MIECRTNIVRRSITKPTENFVGLPDGGNDYDVPIRLAGAVVWAPQSGGGGGAVHVRVFSSPATLWSVLHNLGYRPIVSIFDSAGNEVGAEVQHVSTNEFYVHFAAAVTGSVSYM